MSAVWTRGLRTPEVSGHAFNAHEGGNWAQPLAEEAGLVDAVMAAAVRLADVHGLSVLPLRGKRPATGHGFYDATSDPHEVLELFHAAPTANNVGIAPGPSGLLVVDIDLKKPDARGIQRWKELSARYGQPDTLLVRTGSGGLHLYFQPHPELQVGQVNGAGDNPGIDLRGTKGYVVAPPSTHPDTRKPYCWERSDDFNRDLVQPVPDWLVEFLTPAAPRELSTAAVGSTRSGSDSDRRRVLGMIRAKVRTISDMGPGQGRRTALQKATYALAGLASAVGFSLGEVRASMIEAAKRCGRYDTGIEEMIDASLVAGASAPLPLPLTAGGWGEAKHSRPAPRTIGSSTPQAPSGVDPTAPLILAEPGSKNSYLLRSPQNNGSYLTVRTAHLVTEFKRLFPGRRWQTNADPPRRMLHHELYEAQGWRCDEVRYAAHGASRFVPNDDLGGVLYQRVWAPDPRLRPDQNQEVGHWLALLGGDQHEKLLDWLACSMETRSPIAALVLRGPPSTGKGMLCEAVRLLFGGEAVDYLDISGNFREALLSSPVVVLDEALPARSRSDSSFFRSLVAESRHSIPRKHRSTVTLEGCPRVLITTNSDDPLRLGEERGRSRDDDAAIAARFVHIDVGRDAAHFLKALGGRNYTHNQGWVTAPDGSPGAVARHIRWLVEERGPKVVRGHRFLVEGDHTACGLRLGQRSEMERRVLAALVTEATRFGSIVESDLADRPMFYRKDEALVRTNCLVKCWPELTSQPAPSRSKVGIALRNLAAEGEPWRPKVQQPELSGRKSRPRFWVLSANLLVEAARAFGVDDPDEVRNAFEVDASGLPRPRRVQDVLAS